MTNMRMFTLASLSVHQALLFIVMHYSRTIRKPGEPSYKASSAIILTEFGKLLISFALSIKEVRSEMRKEQLELQMGKTGTILFDSDGADNAYPPSAQSDSTHSSPRLSTSIEHPSLYMTLWRLRSEVFCRECWYLAIPAVLFTLQSKLSYVAISNLSVPVAQVTYQLKILTTAICSVLILKRILSVQQWICLTLLAAGVAMVQLGVQDQDAASHATPPPPTATAVRRELSIGKDNDDITKVPMNQVIGLIAAIAGCFSSGFASVYFEYQLKKPASVPNPPQSRRPTLAAEDEDSPEIESPPQAKKAGLWVRNIQLAMFALAMALLLHIFETGQEIFKTMHEGTGDFSWETEGLLHQTLDGATSMATSFFSGFSPIVWFVVFAQIIGGLLGALVMKYADNVAKCFATSISIIISFIASVFLFDFHITLLVIIGSAFVLAATYAFSIDLSPYFSRFTSSGPSYTPLASTEPSSREKD